MGASETLAKSVAVSPSPAWCPLIRIAFCITELDAGGAERCLAELAGGVDPERFTPLVVSLAGPPRDRVRSVLPTLEAAGAEVRYLDLENWWQTPAAIGRLAAWLRDENIDVVQTLLYHANVIGRLAARRARKSGHCRLRVVSGIRVAERRGRGRGRLRVERLTERWVDRHVCVSEAVARFSIDAGGLDAERIVVIPNGVNHEAIASTAPLEPQQLGVAEGRRVITCVGRLDAQKNVAWLIETAPALFERLPDHDLLLVGDGPLRAQLEQRCTALGVSERVHFAGWRADVPAVLRGSDLLVLPSLWEGMPNVVLEAMAAGIPVVASDVEGVREVLGPSGDVQIARPGDRDDFISRVADILRDDDRARELGAANARRAGDAYSTGAMIRAYETLYESLAGDS